jgi:uncharacterized protein
MDVECLNKIKGNGKGESVAKVIAMLSLVIGATICILVAPSLLLKLNIVLTQSEFLNLQFKYQPILLLVAVAVIFITYLITPANFRIFFRFGKINARATRMPVFFIKEGDTWVKAGIILIFFITLATSLFMFLGMKQMGADISDAMPYLPLILLFSLTNSFSEEMIFRFGTVANTFNAINIKYILLLSAILFGLPHFNGAPGGPIGVLMAGFLGYFLAKSMIETKGFFWVWLIHFLQDVVIMASVVAMNLKA